MEKLAPADLEKRAAAAKLPLLVLFLRKGDKPSDALFAAAAGLSAKTAKKVEVVWADIDQDPKKMDALRIFKVPELLILSGGNVVERAEGAMTAEQLDELVRYTLDMIAT